MSSKVDTFAYYLPQYYPIPLNSLWWGEGYTEWNAVLRAQRGGRSPAWAQLTPGELGFYDLRLRETRAAQAELARAYGLGAFCIYHYYSNGHRPLGDVVDRILRDGEPNHPFFFCWANHNWTLSWMNRPRERIWTQEYSEHVDDSHFEWMLAAFADRRYYSIGGAPVLALYDPTAVPQHRDVFARWRSAAKASGFPGLILLGVAGEVRRPHAQDVGLDGWIESPGASVADMSAVRRAAGSMRTPASIWRFIRYQDYEVPRGKVSEAVRRRPNRDDPYVPTVLASWNNVGRRAKRAWYFRSDPSAFRKDLDWAMEAATPVSRFDPDRRLVGINAWNEWGEMMAIEPSVERGRAMLEVLGDTSA